MSISNLLNFFIVIQIYIPNSPPKDKTKIICLVINNQNRIFFNFSHSFNTARKNKIIYAIHKTIKINTIIIYSYEGYKSDPILYNLFLEKKS